jgi:hypothetical protein
MARRVSVVFALVATLLLIFFALTAAPPHGAMW